MANAPTCLFVFFSENGYGRVMEIAHRWGLEVSDGGHPIPGKPMLVCYEELSMRAIRAFCRFHHISFSIYMHAVDFDGVDEVEH